MAFSLEIKSTGMPVELNASRRVWNSLQRDAFANTADQFHQANADARFTPEHAAKAGYTMRRGQGLTPGTKAFKRSYYGIKLRSSHGGGIGRADPLVWSGRSRARARIPSVTATAKGARIRYSLPALNFKNPNSRVNMREEFNRVLPDEKSAAHRVHETTLRQLIARVREIHTTRT